MRSSAGLCNSAGVRRLCERENAYLGTREKHAPSHPSDSNNNTPTLPNTRINLSLATALSPNPSPLGLRLRLQGLECGLFHRTVLAAALHGSASEVPLGHLDGDEGPVASTEMDHLSEGLDLVVLPSLRRVLGRRLGEVEETQLVEELLRLLVGDGRTAHLTWTKLSHGFQV